MLYVATAQPATAQLGALACDFLESGVPALVVNKLTRLEVSYLNDTPGLTQVLEIPLWSTVAAISSIKLKVRRVGREDRTSSMRKANLRGHLQGHQTSSILVLTTCLQLFAITYSPTAPHVVTSSTVSILEQHGRLAEYQTITVDPELRCIAVHAYTGLLRIVPLGSPPRARRGSKASSRTDSASELAQLDLTRGYSIRLQNLNVTCLSFLPSDSDSAPSIACLSADHLGRRVLDTYNVDLAEKELVSGLIESTIMDDPGSEVLIPIGGELGAEGVLVVGEESVRWVPVPGSEDSGNKGKGKAGGPTRVSCQLPVGLVQAWTAVAGSPDSFLLGDIYGRLQLLHIIRSSSGAVSDLRIRDLGDTSSPTSIVFLSPTLIYIASRFADAQLVQIPSSLSGDAMSVEDGSDDLQLVEGFASLAPIMDCCVVNSNKGGTSHVVTCSGAYKGGSLRIVRQGVGLAELASLELEGIRQVWSILWLGQKLLVLGFISESKVVSLSSSSADADGEEDVEEVDLPVFNTEKATLLAANVGSLLVQVTASGVSYTNEDGTSTNTWVSDDGKHITLAAAANGHLVLALEGGAVVLLEEVGGKLEKKSSSQLPNEVACLDVAVVGSQAIVAIGLWTSHTVVIASLPSLTTLTSQVIDTSYLIRSVLVATFRDGVSHLFAGMGDGSVASYVLDTESWAVQGSSKKTLTLGTTPVSLKVFVAKGSVNVFVSSDRPTIISRSGDRLVYSSVNLKDINSVVPFDSTSFPSSLALASPAGLRIGRIEDIHRVDIRTVPFEEDGPQRIAYDASSSTYGVVCLRRDINRSTGEQTTQGSIKILDAESFEVLSDIPLLEEEEGQSICVLSIGTDKCYAIGTAFVRPGETEPSAGRILLIAQQGMDRTFHQAAGLDIKGCPYSMVEPSPGHLAAAVNSQVIAYTIDDHFSIKSVATWSGAFIALNLSASGNNTLLVGDAMRSMTLLRLGEAPYVLEELARDYRALYMAAIAPLGSNDEYLGAETDLNLFTVQKENVTTARSMADEHALSPRGVFHLGEMVTKFCAGSFVPQYGDQSADAAKSRLVYATSAGSLGVIAELDASSAKTLIELERNLRQVVEGVGGLEHEAWRSFKSERTVKPPAGFLDGNFVQLFASLPKEKIEQVLAGKSEHERISNSESELTKTVEELGRLH
ncbi:DNA damage-binding protein 1, partial [Phenoliferia sp. Uapishka_3]